MPGLIKTGIIGAGGFTGQELIRILKQHPEAENVYFTSNAYEGSRVNDMFPQLNTDLSHRFEKHPEKIEDLPSLDAVFLAVPDSVSLKWVPLLEEAGIKTIDLAGAFRLQNKSEFEKYYGLEHTAEKTLENAVYGMPEYFREIIKSAKVIANPGCYPSAILLSVLPFLQFSGSFDKNIFIDAKSGSSGAGGRKEKDSLGFSDVNENFRAYKAGRHQHTPEISQFIREITGEQNHVLFTPHLLPMFRGILANTYIRLEQPLDEQKLRAAAEEYAERETFARFYKSIDELNLRKVQFTNFCDFSYMLDNENGTLMITGVIDNLVKGAAGQAVQNLNLLFGLPESDALL